MIAKRLGPYEITAKLGEGGMGEVYRATDTKLKRDVAIKVLPQEFTQDKERLARFEREAQLLAQLQHPNIASIYGLEESNGAKALVMELVEGPTLAERLEQGPLPFNESLSVALQIAQALEEAHEKGIVHRDLKPQNIKASIEGKVKVLDFGLAKDIEERPSDPEAPTLLETQAGTLLGTVPYMSPEQLRGERLDARSDLFSLGIVLYELVAGARPFAGATAAELSGAILRDSPPPLATRISGVPPEFERILRRCLEKSSRDRFASARALYDELRLLQRDTTGLHASSPGSVERSQQAIAVLPFSDLSPGRDQEALCEGMAEEITNALVVIEGLRVAARTSAGRVKREGLDPEAIARLLKVDLVLDGSVRTAGKRLRVTAQLVDTSNGFQVWNERFDRESEDIFAVQDEIAAGVSSAVRSRLGRTATGAAEPRQRDQFANLDAYQAYLRARHLRYSKNDLVGALATYREAVAIDPGCSPAWVGTAEITWLACFYGMTPVAEARATSDHALARARELAGETAEAAFVAGLAEYCARRWPDARRNLTRAVELNPHRVEFRCWLGSLHGALHEFDEAARQFERARAIDPVAAYPYALSAYGELQARRPTEALELALQAREFAPGLTAALWASGIALVALGRAEEAIEPLERAADERHRGSFVHGVLGWALAAAGRCDEARDVLAALAARPAGAAALVSEAWLRAELGDLEGGWAVLDRAEVESQFGLTMRDLPGFDRFRSDPRFPALVERLGLPR